MGRKLSSKAKAFIKCQIKGQIGEGKGQKQAVAIAFSKARKKGFKVPRKPAMKHLR